MTSASLVFKNFNLQYKKALNEISAIVGQDPPDVEAAMAFPSIKAFFHTFPDVHMRVLAKHATIDDVAAFFDFLNHEPPEIGSDKLEALRPVFYRLGKTIPPING